MDPQSEPTQEREGPFARRGAFGRARLLAPLGVALGALLLLLAHVPLFETERLHVREPNDQVGYVTTARWLAETGELRSHLVVPAYVDQPDWRLYMPGHYAVLALSYRLLGDGPWTWRLPNVLAYVLSATLVFLIGRRLYGVGAGLLAALLFALFPSNVADAFTAMSEPTFCATSLLAFLAFVYLPVRLRWNVVPLLLVLPFLFRETAALLVLPVVALALSEGGGGRRAALRATVGSVLTLGLVYLWQKAAGKQSPPYSWIATGKPNYDDALLEERLADPTLAEWASAVAFNLGRNVEFLWTQFREEFLERSEPPFLVAIALLVAFSVLGGLRRGRRDRLPLAAAAMAVASLLLLLFFHKAYAHVATRHLLFTVPFLALAVASEAVECFLPARPRTRFTALGVGLTLLVCLSHLGIRNRARETVRDVPGEYAADLEALGHDDSKLLVCLTRWGLGYTLDHYPVRWSFVPANDETFRRLAARFEIGTVILENVDVGKRVKPATLEELGLEYVGTYQGDNMAFQKRR